MDEQYRHAIRTAMACGEEVELAKMLLQQMNVEQRQRIIRFAGFLCRRQVVTWELAGKGFVIATLPDSIIKDIVVTTSCKRIYRLAGSDDPWTMERARRSAYYVIMQEAEYRGIRCVWWTDSDQERIQRRLFPECLDVRHNFSRVADGLICLNCQQKVTDEEVSRAMPARVRLL